MTAIDLGSFVPAPIVARWTGRCSRTIAKWIRDGIVQGCHVKGPRHKRGRWYVRRSDALALRDGILPGAPNWPA